MTRKSLHMILIFLGCQSINLPNALAEPCKDLETKCIDTWKSKGMNAVCKSILTEDQIKKWTEIKILDECESYVSIALVHQNTEAACPAVVLQLRDLVKYGHKGEYCVGD